MARKKIRILVSPSYISVTEPTKAQQPFWIGKNKYHCVRKAMKKSAKMKKGVKLVIC